MRTEFPYLRLTKGDKYRPYIPVLIQYKKGSETALALLDSGADFTLIPRYIASNVGLSLKPNKMQPISGVGGSINVYKTQATLVFCIEDMPEITLKSVPVMVPEQSDFRYTLLGRDSIFKEFIISFNEYEKKVIFEKRYD